MSYRQGEQFLRPQKTLESFLMSSNTTAPTSSPATE